MQQTVSSAPVPSGVHDDSAEQLRLEADFEARWAAWQAPCKIHDRTIRHKLLIAAPAMTVTAAIVNLVMIG